MSGFASAGLRALVTAGAVLVTGTLTACGPSGPEPGSTPSVTASPSVTSSPTDLRGRLVAALQPTSPANAKLVESPQSKLTPVSAEWLSGWQILDVTNPAPPHPRRFYVALSTDGRAEVLSGQPDAFSRVLADAGVDIGSASVATDVAEVFLDATRDFRVFAYRVDSIGDVKWLPRPTAAQEASRDQLVKDYRGRVKPAQAAESGDGWQVTAWMVSGRNLVEHTVDLASGTAVTDQAKTVEQDIPVPYSA